MQIIIKLIYRDADVIVCIKPPRVLSTDEPGGVPELIRETLGNPNADVRTVHRLDRVVSGLMVLAGNPQAAADLSKQIREGVFHKRYLAVVHGAVEPICGELRDLLYRDKARRMTFVTQTPSKDAREAILNYRVIHSASDMSRVEIDLVTGRTHQIRVQFASRSHPLVGERKYAELEDPCEIALWSHQISFCHPKSGENLTFTVEPENCYPWDAV